VLIWQGGARIEHYQVDGGGPGPLKNLSPMMVDDRVVEVGYFHQNFMERSWHINPLVREFVLNILDDFQHPRP
jgi:hypothetical protein